MTRIERPVRGVRANANEAIDIRCPKCSEQMAIGTRAGEVFWRCMSPDCLWEYFTGVRVFFQDCGGFCNVSEPESPGLP